MDIKIDLDTFHQPYLHQLLREAVTLATIHGTKGLEWESVFLVGVNQGIFPIGYAQSLNSLTALPQGMFLDLREWILMWMMTWRLGTARGSHGMLI